MLLTNAATTNKWQHSKLGCLAGLHTSVASHHDGPMQAALARRAGLDPHEVQAQVQGRSSSGSEPV
jgi:hypothetical protein